MKRKIYNLLSGAKHGLFALVMVVLWDATYSQTYTMVYTGGIQSLTVQAGNYSIECWGANGGGITASPGGSGIGGYSKGEYFVVSNGTQLNVFVGGKGIDATGSTASAGAGGWNGGGGGAAVGRSGGGGGGASDVRVSGIAATDRIIVAGGGGGAAYYAVSPFLAKGGDGGGLTGQNGDMITISGVHTIGGGGAGANGATPGVATVGTANGTATGGGGGGSSAGSSIGQPGTGGGPGGAAGPSAGGLTGSAGGGGGGYAGGAGGVQSSNAGVAGGGGSGYIGGVTNAITVQSVQPGYVPNPDVNGNGYVRIIRLCDVNASASSNPICEGETVVLSTNAGSNIQWGHGPITPTILVSPQTTTSYTVSGVSSSSTACSGTVVITVSVNPLPDIAAVSFPPLVCAGNTGTLMASGAASYTWSNGPEGSSNAVNPPVTTVYTVTGESAEGCLNTQTVELTVNANVVALAPTESVCAGKTATLTASGLSTYSWSTGSHFNALVVSPLTSSLYFVQGVDPFGCILTGSVSLTVHDAPNVGINASKTQICRGEPITLEGTGADQYQWSTNESTAQISRVLNVDIPHQFTVTGTNSQGCTDTEMITIQVAACLSVGNELLEQATLYPNPTSGQLRLEDAPASSAVHVTDVAGKLLMRLDTVNGDAMIDLSEYDSGVYYLTISAKGVRKVVKVLKQ